MVSSFVNALRCYCVCVTASTPACLHVRLFSFVPVATIRFVWCLRLFVFDNIGQSWFLLLLAWGVGGASYSF